MSRVNLPPVKERVKTLLENKLTNRDDDGKLIGNIWIKEIKQMGLDPNSITAMQFLALFVDGEFTHPESIRRVRAKLQEVHPELRGQLYNKRKGIEPEIQDDLFNPELWD